MKKEAVPLAANWSFKKASAAADAFRPVAQFPTNVHLDLLHHKLIPDPFFAENEKEVQWIGEEDWVYRTTFASPPGSEAGRKSELVFDGLDTYATVTVNGKEVLKSDNMFIPYRVDVTDVLKADGGANELEIVFESAFVHGRKIQEQYPDFHWGCWNGDASRLAVRKAQYHYGWDWGPVLMTCGPWRPIHLETFTSRISEFSTTVVVDESLSHATVEASVTVAGAPCGRVDFYVRSASGTFKPLTSCAMSSNHGNQRKWTFEVSGTDLELWYPSGHGAQPLYTVGAHLYREATADWGEYIDSTERKVGLRRLRLVQQPLVEAEGTSFFFEVNNVRIWAAGVNWIPADNFLPRLTPSHYARWLHLVRDGRFNMIRVWGGGVYEDAAFYDLCDELGILVWQDFGFGCGNYPAHIPAFRESVEAEAVAQVKRLRHHPSITLWAGNNEDYSYMWGIPGRLGYDATDENPDNWLQTQFPARYIYEKILPDAVAAHGNGGIYHRGSPYGGVTGYGCETGPSGADPQRGDIHQWNVWHGTQEPYQNYDQLAGRFVSEFGMDALPTLLTLQSVIPRDRTGSAHAQSRLVEHHSKADGAEGRLGKYLLENFPFQLHPLPAYVYATQLLQAEALTAAYRAWRRNWKGPGKEYTAGAIVWQINDCWPVTSWAIVDYGFRPKLAYYAIRRELAEVAIGTKRAVVRTPKSKYTDADAVVEHRLQVWAANFSAAELAPTQLRLTAFDAASGTRLAERTLTNVELPANQSTELVEDALPGWDGRPDGNWAVVVKAALLAGDGRVLAAAVSWPEPLKYVDLARDPGVAVEVVDDAAGVLRVRADKPVKGLVLEVDEANGAVVGWSDNCLDLVPGDAVQVTLAGGLKGREVRTSWLGKAW